MGGRDAFLIRFGNMKCIACLIDFCKNRNSPSVLWSMGTNFPIYKSICLRKLNKGH